MNEMSKMKVRAGGQWHELEGPTLAQGQKCFAWISFNGQGTPSAYGSHNIGGIQDNGRGDYTVSYATEAPSDRYSITTQSNGTKGNNSDSELARVVGVIQRGNANKASFRVQHYTVAQKNYTADPVRTSVLVFEKEEQDQ